MTTDALAFAQSCIAADERIKGRLTAERDRWRAILVEVVSERTAERMYRQSFRCTDTPAPED